MGVLPQKIFGNQIKVLPFPRFWDPNNYVCILSIFYFAKNVIQEGGLGVPPPPRFLKIRLRILPFPRFQDPNMWIFIYLLKTFSFNRGVRGSSSRNLLGNQIKILPFPRFWDRNNYVKFKGFGKTMARQCSALRHLLLGSLIMSHLRYCLCLIPQAVAWLR